MTFVTLEAIGCRKFQIDPRTEIRVLTGAPRLIMFSVGMTVPNPTAVPVLTGLVTRPYRLAWPPTLHEIIPFHAAVL